MLAIDSPDGLTAADLLARVNLSKPTLYRLLYTLQSLDFIRGEGDPLRFRLGPAIGQLSQTWLSGLDIEKSSMPVLRSIWEQTQETVALYVRDDKRRICLQEIVSPQPLSFRRGTGASRFVVEGGKRKGHHGWNEFGPG